MDFEPQTSSVSGCRRSRPSSSLAAVTWANACCALFGLPSVSCAYPRGPQRSRDVVGPSLAHVHGSGGGAPHLSNWCTCLLGVHHSPPRPPTSFRVFSGSWKLSAVTARTSQGMVRVRPGQAPAWPLVSDRSVRRELQGQACTLTGTVSPVLVALRAQSRLGLEGRTRTLSGPSPDLTSSVSVQGQAQLSGFDLAIVGGGEEPDGLVV